MSRTAMLLVVLFAIAGPPALAGEPTALFLKLPGGGAFGPPMLDPPGVAAIVEHQVNPNYRYSAKTLQYLAQGVANFRGGNGTGQSHLVLWFRAEVGPRFLAVGRLGRRGWRKAGLSEFSDANSRRPPMGRWVCMAAHSRNARAIAISALGNDSAAQSINGGQAPTG